MPRIAFFGTSDFAVPSLDMLAEAGWCSLVVTQPDRPAGRGRHVSPTPVKSAAQRRGLPIIQPPSLRRDALPELSAQTFDAFAVVSYGQIVPQRLLDLPKWGAFNVHPSLLPLYRGATPLQAQLRDGVTESGVTIILMDAGMDTGDLVAQERCVIGERETYGALHDRFAERGAMLLKQTLEEVARGEMRRTAQRSLAAPEVIERTLTRPLRKEDARLSVLEPQARTMRAIVDLVRSLSPKPGLLVTVDGLTMTITAARASVSGPDVALHEVTAGVGIIVDGWILLRATDGWVMVEELREPGGRTTDIRQFRNGYGNRRLPASDISPESMKEVQTWYDGIGRAALRELW